MGARRGKQGNGRGSAGPRRQPSGSSTNAPKGTMRLLLLLLFVCASSGSGADPGARPALAFSGSGSSSGSVLAWPAGAA